jgi:hypothetical protein
MTVWSSGGHHRGVELFDPRVELLQFGTHIRRRLQGWHRAWPVGTCVDDTI